MKKTLSALLVGSMLMFPIPALASDDADTIGPEVLQFLAFDKIEDEVEKRSPVLEALINTRNITDEQFDAQEDQLRKSFADAQSQGLEGQIAYNNILKSYYTGLREVELAKETPDPTAIQKYDERITQSQDDIAAYNLALNSLGSVSLPDDMEENLEQNKKYTLRQLALSTKIQKDSLVMAIQQAFQGYQTLNDSMAEFRSQKELLENQLSVVKLQQSLGIVIASNANQLEITIENLNTTINTMTKSLADIKANINLLLGQPYDTPLTLGAIPELDKKQMSEIDYESDFETALDNNYNIRIQQVVYTSKDYAVDYADDNNKHHDEQIAEDERANAQIQIESLKRKLALTFDQAYRNVQDKTTAVDLAQSQLSIVQTTWQQVQLKYELGLISKLEMDNNRANYDMGKRNLQTAQQELFTAFNNYQWVINGMD